MADSDNRWTTDNDLPYTDPKFEPRSYEQVRDDKENKSRDGRWSTYERVPGDGFNSDVILEHVGKPGD